MLSVKYGCPADGNRDEDAPPDSNGDRWRLARDIESGRVFVRHEANLPSGGRVTEVDLATFLGAGERGPEQQALLRLIGGLVEDPIRA
jgi:hypothetical protein